MKYIFIALFLANRASQKVFDTYHSSIVDTNDYTLYTIFLYCCIPIFLYHLPTVSTLVFHIPFVNVSAFSLMLFWSFHTLFGLRIAVIVVFLFFKTPPHSSKFKSQFFFMSVTIWLNHKTWITYLNNTTLFIYSILNDAGVVLFAEQLIWDLCCTPRFSFRML